MLRLFCLDGDVRVCSGTLPDLFDSAVWRSRLVRRSMVGYACLELRMYFVVIHAVEEGVTFRLSGGAC